ncbi:hypothetical protein [Nocardioides speluncae]|uniref:hypothetical protein n=1 Tax=Nocardioides speluncae TaxID=2670337 RepID=UPI000D697E14|nr:hypothetical protein [Nocardioides speluncae]
MSDRTLPPITSVTGGSGGLAATYDRVRDLADDFDGAGNRMRAWAGAGARTLGNGDLIESAPLSPLTFADAELSVLAATTGPRGILPHSAGWEADAVVVRATVAAFDVTDQIVRASFEAIDYAIGLQAGFLIGRGAALSPALLPVLARPLLAGVTAYGLYRALPPHLRRELSDAAGDLSAPARRRLCNWLAANPEVLQHAMNGGGGLLDGLALGAGAPLAVPGLAPFHPSANDAAGSLAGLLDDGRPVVSRRPDLDPESSPPPRNLQELLANLDRLNELSDQDHPENNGTIQIQQLGSGEERRYIVYLPGTDVMNPLAAGGEHTRDMLANGRLVDGEQTTHGRGVLEALRQAGVPPDAPLLLAGHSQGGMQAAHLAATDSGYHVTDVVVAGAPTAQVPSLPGHVSLLALENAGDIVPLTDGEDSPDQPNRTTVRFDQHEPEVLDNHDLHHYVAGAAAVDASGHPSITSALDHLRTNGFLTGHDSAAVTTTFQVTRAH